MTTLSSCDDRLSNKFKNQLERGEIRDAFLSGACYYFALWIVSDRLKSGRVERCRDKVNKASHAYIILDDSRCVDIDGVMCREDFMCSLETRFKIAPEDREFKQLDIGCLISRVENDRVRREVLRDLKDAALKEFDTAERFCCGRSTGR